MFDKRSFIAPVVVVVLLVSALAQDPTGRPTGTKGKPTPGKSKPTTKEPPPVTVMLTVLTEPPESAVFINGEQRGVSNSDGKIQFDKLPLSHYTIEVRKE